MWRLGVGSLRLGRGLDLEVSVCSAWVWALCVPGAARPPLGSGCAGPLRGLPCVCWSRRAATCSVALFPGGPGAILGGAIRPAAARPRPGRKEQVTPLRIVAYWLIGLLAYWLIGVLAHQRIGVSVR